MKIRVDFRLVLLLVIAVAFLHSSLQLHKQQEYPVIIEGNFVNFDYEEIFNVSVIPESCPEESSLPSPLQAL